MQIAATMFDQTVFGRQTFMLDTTEEEEKKQYGYGYFYPEIVWELATPVKPQPLIHHWIHICMRNILNENAIVFCVIYPDMFLNKRSHDLGIAAVAPHHIENQFGGWDTTAIKLLL